jgi:alcohol dehydrogenase
MLRLMRLVIARRIDLTPLFTHVFSLDEIERAYGVFESRKEFVLKVAIRVR